MAKQADQRIQVMEDVQVMVDVQIIQIFLGQDVIMFKEADGYNNA